MTRFLKVEGNPSLVRDTHSNAIINTNESEYENYMKLKAKMLERKSQDDKNSEDINNLKQDMEEIKTMLRVLINKEN
jgi:hypothetical protein